jgi:alkanesulfonate monooxygenase SsuD/methylene tetrahydromethanopterin reductase-like flavin-dependent oxidoreductase (luciferase family)
MDFGIFDHIDASGAPLAEFYEQRLELAALYDRLGFFGYHVAEHHATPLGLAPSPGLFLAALAQRTRRLRFGPLIYILPLYHPLRLIEEICMLDQLSRGRLLLGVGRGISPYEVAYYGIDPAETQARYVEALDLIRAGLAADILDFRGKFYRVENVPMILKPVQAPHPPLWYGAINPEAAAWLARNRVNTVSHVAAPLMGEIVRRYRAEWAAAGHGGEPLPKLGLGRHIVVAETKGEALAIGRRAYARWFESFTWLWRRHGTKPISVTYTSSFDEMIAAGIAIAGAPGEVRDAALAHARQSGCNYWISRFAFGDMSLPEAARSATLFAEHVMPALREKV